jgi:hypothetical protein
MHEYFNFFSDLLLATGCHGKSVIENFCNRESVYKGGSATAINISGKTSVEILSSILTTE